ELSRTTGSPLVATNDLHYTVREDAKPHDVLLCIQQQKVQTDTNRLRFDSDQFYMKSAEEMREAFRDLPEACDNTLRIAEMCELELSYGDLHLPRFEPPAGRGRMSAPGATTSSTSSPGWGSPATS